VDRDRGESAAGRARAVRRPRRRPPRLLEEGDRALPGRRRGSAPRRGRLLRILAVTILSSAIVGAAAAAPGEPQKELIPAVQARAKAVDVQRSDLPGSGWTAHPSTANGDTPRCSYYTPDQSDLTENGDASSPEFTLTDGSFVSSSTGIFLDAKQGRTAYARVVRPALPRCLAEVFRKGTGHPSQVTITSAEAVPWPRVADRTNAYRIGADFHVSATQTVVVTLDVVSLNHGKVDTVVFFAGVDKPFAAAFERGVVAKVAARALRIS
jgi:hypothetical protein